MARRTLSLPARRAGKNAAITPTMPAAITIVTSDTTITIAATALITGVTPNRIADQMRTGSGCGDSPVAVCGSVRELPRPGLSEREFLVGCRQAPRSLGRIGDVDDDTRPSILRLSCPTCGRRFDEELRALIQTWGDRTGVKNHVFAPAPPPDTPAAQRTAGAGHVLQMHPVQEQIVGSAGRAIWIPAPAAGGAKKVGPIAGAYAAVRRQFGVPSGRFEGIEEPLARIAG